VDFAFAGVPSTKALGFKPAQASNAPG
jgi:hypothetical protein